MEKNEENNNLIIHNENYIVGIGASAGGLEAIEKFFENMPHNEGISFVIIQHLSPDYKSFMVEILSKKTKMNVLEAKDGEEVLPNHIYIIPRRKNMTVYHNKLYLKDQSYSHANLNLPIYIFFESLALDKKSKSIAVILSGTGSDGTKGISFIKTFDGLIIVQELSSAKFNGMPSSALSTGFVDCSLPVEKIPDTILDYLQSPKKFRELIEEKNLEKTNILKKILIELKNYSNIDFQEYKSNTLTRRIKHRIGINNLNDYDSYYKYLLNNKNEFDLLCKELLVGITRFFRDKEAFDIIEKKVIPDLINNSELNSQIRIWTTGCSTGQEVYSLAILFKEYIIKNNIDKDIKIFATDVDKNSINHASLGVFNEDIVYDISPERLKNFFIKKGKKYYIVPEIREMIIFAIHNIIKDPPFSKIDFISCRNLLIYLQPHIQKKVFSIFNFSINNNGYIFLGPSENLSEQGYKTINSKWKIYKLIEPKIPNNKLKDYSYNSNKINNNILRKGYYSNFETNLVSIDFNFDDALETLFNETNLSALIINESLNLLHVFGDTNSYLKLPKGKVNLNILNLFDKELGLIVSSSIKKAFKTFNKLIYRDLKLNIKDREILIDISFIPIKNSKLVIILI